MRRVILALAYVGAILFILGGMWALMDLAFVCFGGCKPADVPNKVSGLVPHFAPVLLPGIVIMTVAWVVCLTLLRRAQWQIWFRTVFAAPTLIFLLSALGLGVTWNVFAQTSAHYRTVAEGSYPIFFFTAIASVLLTLVSNFIVIIAGHALRRATVPGVLTPARATAGGWRHSASD